MPKTRQQKTTDVDQLTKALQGMKGVVFSGFVGLTVKENTELRSLLRKEGVTLTVAKRTLLKKALKEANLPEVPETTFPGGVQLAIASQDEIAPARVLYEYAKKHPALTLRGGFLGTALLTPEQVMSLATLPGKDALRGQLASVIAAPLRGFVSVLAGPLRGLVTVLSKRAEQST